jgi:hypothetical protein
LVIITHSKSEENYYSSKFEQSPGINFENVGNVKFYNSEWQLITYVDIENLQERLKVVEAIHKKTVAFVYKNKKMYKPFAEIGQALAQIADRVSEIFNFVGHTKLNRRKRAWFDIIGRGEKILFGTLDDEDAKFYAEKINKFEKNDHTFADLIKDQSKVVKSTISNFNSSIQNLNIN